MVTYIWEISNLSITGLLILCVSPISVEEINGFVLKWLRLVTTALRQDDSQLRVDMQHHGMLHSISPELRHVSNGNKMYCSMLHLFSHWQCYTRGSGLLHLCIGVSSGLHARVVGASADYTLISYCYVIFHTISMTCYVMRSQDDVMRSKGCGNLLIDLRFFPLLASRFRFHSHF